MMHPYLHSLGRVFLSGRYIITTVITFIVLLLLFLFLSQIFVIRQFFLTNASLSDKLSVMIDSMYTAFIHLGAGDLLYLILFALLGAMQVALLRYRIKERVGEGGVYTKSVGGMILAFIGIGCGACGSVLVTSAIALFIGTGNALLFTSQWGSIVGVVGIGFLIYAIVSTLKSISRPLLCE